MGKKSNSLIRNNLRGMLSIRSIGEAIAEDLRKAPRRNEIIFDGLVCALKRTDPDWQEWMNTCSSYPELVYYSKLDEMEKIFALIHKRICDIIFLNEYRGDIVELNDHYDDLADYRSCLSHGQQL